MQDREVILDDNTNLPVIDLVVSMRQEVAEINNFPRVSQPSSQIGIVLPEFDQCLHDSGKTAFNEPSPGPAFSIGRQIHAYGIFLDFISCLDDINQAIPSNHASWLVSQASSIDRSRYGLSMVPLRTRSTLRFSTACKSSCNRTRCL